MNTQICYWAVLIERRLDVQAATKEEAMRKARLEFINWLSDTDFEDVEVFNNVWEVSSDG